MIGPANMTPAPEKVEQPRFSLLGKVKSRLWRSARRENGTASMEFVLVVPAVLMLFMASIEAGVLMTRFIMLEQALDMTMRDLRLGKITAASSAEMYVKIKDEVCKRTIMLKDCETTINLELQPVSTTTWSFPTSRVGCINRADNIKPPINFNPGAAHQVMLVRVCVPQDAVFPTTGIGLNLPKDSGGAYGLVAASAFVNEP